jgi:alpha-methylacyl-CoA racemase
VPWGTELLAEMGASVLRIDRSGRLAVPGRMPVGADNPAVELDLKRPEDQERARALITRADVLVEGMRPGVMEKLGLGPTPCLALQPALVYARMTGWGQSGPLADRAGHDINYIGLTGALHAIGRDRETPVVPLNLIGDFGGGGTFLVIGVLAALLHARATGRGQVVDAAMVDGSANLMKMVYSRYAGGNWIDRRGANALDGGSPWYDVYRTADGHYMAVGAIEPAFYAQLLGGLGIAPDSVPDRADRAGWPVLRARFAQVFACRTRAAWTAVFDSVDACVTPVLSLAEAPDHPHNLARQVFTRQSGHAVPAPAPRFAGVPAANADDAEAAPALGSVAAVQASRRRTWADFGLVDGGSADC